jgi:hypothetical protein
MAGMTRMHLGCPVSLILILIGGAAGQNCSDNQHQDEAQYSFHYILHCPSGLPSLTIAQKIPAGNSTANGKRQIKP